jgi:hypothetical protein
MYVCIIQARAAYSIAETRSRMAGGEAGVLISIIMYIVIIMYICII